MTKANYIQWLETQIVRAQELGGMDLEIWAFRQCLKKARDLGQELPIPDSVGQGEQLKAFADWLQSDTANLNYDFRDLVDEYLKSL